MTQHSSTTVDHEQLRADETAWLPALFNTGCRENAPVALWQLPFSGKREGLLASGICRLERHPAISEGEKGFVVSPFINPQGKDTLLLQDGIYFSSDEGTGQIAGEGVSNDVQTALQEQLSGTEGAMPEWPVSRDSRQQEQNRTAFEAMIQKAMERLKQEDCEKVVVSRTRLVILDQSFDPVIAFKRLCEAYPGAFVYLIALPGYGTWLGATPELLLGHQQDGLFRSVALAGTQPAREKQPEEVAWTQKEIAEQALVSRFIINCFKQIRLREFREYGPKTVQAGNLMHLMTEYQVDTKAVDFPELPDVMLELLHPTSAVCGIPREPALDFIKEEEPHNRELYSGFLGPVNFNGETRLFVNLRSMQLLKDQALLYAGAGITADSVPEKEWKETEIKCETLLGKVFSPSRG